MLRITLVLAMVGLTVVLLTIRRLQNNQATVFTVFTVSFKKTKV